MEAMRQSWSDDRLDDLSKRVDEGFIRVDGQFARVEDRIDRLDEKLEARFDHLDAKIDTSSHELRMEMKAGFDDVNARFDRMQQTMMQIGAGLIGVLVASSAGLIATQL